MPGATSQLRTPTPHTMALQRPVLAMDPAVRAVTVIGLITVGIVHALEIQGQLHGAVWLTVGFSLLAPVATAAGLWLLARPSPGAWGFSGLVCLSAACGYILTRSIPVPGDTGDAGNWLEPLGVVAGITEIIVVALAALVLSSVLRAGGIGEIVSTRFLERLNARRRAEDPAA
ncbi:MAG: hypothetical protein JOY82_19150 [Streptosporangiaceae bacterium]|nr:hypothetical protein [Streptosporangiaceae bacterium]MBV9856603.1 hypothetical protein [Streptosporangiaceae bacterium]